MLPEFSIKNITFSSAAVPSFWTGIIPFFSDPDFTGSASRVLRLLHAEMLRVIRKMRVKNPKILCLVMVLIFMRINNNCPGGSKSEMEASEGFHPDADFFWLLKTSF
jgi:hypothetical protein